MIINSPILEIKKLKAAINENEILKNLENKGIIHKTNKNKTFHLCNTSSEHEHNAVLAVCNDCGIVEELKTKLFSKIIKHVKSKKRFNFENFNLEITTTCKECA